MSAQISNDLRLVVSVHDCHVRVWDVTAKKMLGCISQTGCTLVRFSPDGTSLGILSGCTLKIYELRKPTTNAEYKVIKTYTFEGLTSFAFNKSGRLLAVGCTQRLLVVDL